jgi:hypothetical protein
MFNVKIHFKPSCKRTAYAEALAFLGGKLSRKVGHNTYLSYNGAEGEGVVKVLFQR